MALTLTKETGAGVSGANSYADAADGDAYHEAHVYAATWTAATVPDKEKALVMATRLIDACFTFNGSKVAQAQALQWPRFDCPDPDASAVVVPGLLRVAQTDFPSDAIPQCLLDATCELARLLLGTDLTQGAGWDGLESFRLEGAMKLEFRPGALPSMLPEIVRQYLAKLGLPARSGGGMVKLQRT